MKTPSNKYPTNTHLECDVVMDLLPLYHDDVVSTQSKLYITEHLEECPNCQKELEKIRKELPEQNLSPSTSTLAWLGKRQHLDRIAVFSLFSLCLLLFSFWFFSHAFTPEQAIRKTESDFGVSFEIVGTLGIGNETAYFVLQSQGTRQQQMGILVPERSGLFYNIHFYSTVSVHQSDEHQQYTYVGTQTDKGAEFIMAASWGQASHMDLGGYALQGVAFDDYSIFYGGTPSGPAIFDVFNNKGELLDPFLW